MKKTSVKVMVGMAVILYLIQVYFKFSEMVVPQWYSSYFADLICLPLMLYFALVAIRFIKRQPHFLLNEKMILFTWVYLSIIFELVLPNYSSRYTADPFDVIIYGLGGILFYLFQRRYLAKT